MSKISAVPREDVGIETKAALLPLDAPRSVAFATKTGKYIYHFRRVAQAEWLKFYQGIVNQTLQTRGAREQVFETESALIDLVDRNLASVDGYGEIKVKQWQRALPMHHRLAAGIALRSIGHERGNGESQLCDLVTVSLSANWGVSDGKMTHYSGLTHCFRQPGIEEMRRFNFESARVRVTGTADNGVTSYPARQAIAMKIYDDLIDTVDGYSVAGRPLLDVDEIKREMDGDHKAAAALALFSQEEEITIE